MEASIKDAERCKGLVAFNDLADNYGHHLPGNPADLFDWLLEQPQDTVLSLLAFGAAHSVNAVEKKFADRRNGIEQANQLGRALKLHMPDWFETTGDSYFRHVNRTTIELAVAEAKGGEAELSVRAAAKKSEAVTIADRLVAGSGWYRLRCGQTHLSRRRSATVKTCSLMRLSKISRRPATLSS